MFYPAFAFHLFIYLFICLSGGVTLHKKYWSDLYENFIIVIIVVVVILLFYNFITLYAFEQGRHH